MALVISDRVRETTTTTGTGTITLAGAVTNFETFTSNLSDGDTTYYAIVDNTNNAFEVGLGTFTASGTTLARTTIIASSNSNNAVNLAAGTKQVFITVPADKMLVKDASGDVALKTSDGGILKLQTSDTIIGVETLGAIEFSAPDEADGSDAILTAASISAESRTQFTSSANPTNLIFKTGSSGTPSTSYIMGNDGILRVYSNNIDNNIGAIQLNSGNTSSSQGNVIFTNSAGQLCFATDNNISQIVFKLDDEDGQPIFTFSEEGGTAILDGGDTDVTVHKPLIANSTYTGGGLMTTGGNIVIPDAGNIGSASDTDAIAIASDGAVTLSSALTVDNVTINGNTISTSGSLTLDVGGDITIDAGGSDITLSDDGTDFALIEKAGNDLQISTQVTYGDIVLKGSIGGAYRTLARFDTSNDGKAILNDVSSTKFIAKNGVQTMSMFLNSDGQLCFGGTTTIVFTLDDEDGQPIFTFSEEDGTAILDGGDTDVTVHKPLIANSTYTGGGLMTTGGNIVIPNAGNIGSASDTDAIAIASDGKVTFSQELIAPSLDISGNVDVDGTLEADAITVNGTALGTVIAGTTVTLASTVTVTDSTANTNFPVVFHDESNGLLDDTGALRYNPSTGELLVPKLTVAGTTTTVDTVTMNAQNAIVFEGATADANETTLTITDPTADRTITLPDTTGTVSLVGATETLTNKTLTTPVIAEIDNSGDITLDSGGDIVLDAGGEQIIFKDGSTNVGHIDLDSDNLTIKSLVSDADIVFKGNDGGSEITALTLDMSGGGTANFLHGVKSGQYFWMTNDDNTALFAGANFEIRLNHVHDTGFRLNNSGTGTPAVELQFVDSNESIGSDGTNLLLKSGGNAITVPNTGADTATLNAATQTLTNKTLTTPIITEIDSGSTITLDATTDIILDADGGDIFLKDGGTTFGEFTNSSTDFVIKSTTSDKDIIFKGNDGGSEITALTLDMSDSGTATFNSGANFSNNVSLGDSNILNIGAGNDLQLYHNSSNSVIANQTGHFYLVNGADNTDIIFMNDDGSGGTTNYFVIDGGAETVISEKPFIANSTTTLNDDVTFTGNNYNLVWDKSANYLRFGDNARASFGASDDLTIRHSDSLGDINTYFYNNTGDLVFTNGADDKDIRLVTDDGSGGNATYILLDGSEGEVNLYHAASGSSSVKLTTKSTGIEVTGTVIDDGATHDGDVTFTGNSYNMVWDKSDNALEFEDDAKIYFGSSNDLEIQHLGGTQNSVIKNYTNSLAILNYSNDNDVDIYSDNGSGGVSLYFRADGSEGEAILYHYGSEKLATKTDGVEITGDLTAKTSDGAILKLQTSDTSVVDGNVLGAIEFSAPDEASGGDAITTAFSIIGEADSSYSSGSNAADLVFKADTTEVMRLEHTGNVSFPVGNITAKDSSGAVLNLQTSDTSVGQNQQLGAIQFQAPDESSGSDADNLAAAIVAQTANSFTSSNNSTDILFKMGVSETATEKMRFTHDGTLEFADAGGSIGLVADDDMVIFNANDVTVKNKDLIVTDVITGIIQINTTDSSVNDGEIIGRINFTATADSAGGDANLLAASIVAEADADFSATVNQTDLVFMLGQSEAATEKMRLEHEGTLKLGSDTVATREQLKGDATNGAGVFSDEIIARKIHNGTILTKQDDSSQGLIAGRPNGGFFSQQTLTQDRVFFMPIFIPGTGASGNFTVGGFRFRTGFNGTVNNNTIKMGLYTLNKFGYPSQLVSKSSASSGTSNNADIVATPDVTSITPGRYAMCIASAGGSTLVVANFNNSGSGGSFFQEGFSDVLTSQRPTGMFIDNGLSSNELPTDLSSTTGYSDASGVPYMMVTFGETYTGE